MLTVPVMLERVRVVPEIEPVAEKDKVDEAVTTEDVVLYPVGVTPLTAIIVPTGMLKAGTI
jgi:hypothetical protein